MGNIEAYEVNLYPYRTDKDSVVEGKYITTRSSPSSTLIGAYFEFENTTSIFTLYEMTLIIKPPNDWFSNLRLPMYFNYCYY